MAREEDRIRGMARAFAGFVEANLGVRLETDAAAVEWIDGYVEANRPLPPEYLDAQSTLVGAFLGECVIAAYGGEWARVDGEWAVRFDERNAVFPFAKTRKQWENGAEDSVRSFYEMISVVYPHLQGPPRG
jgi:hypothetical protein